VTKKPLPKPVALVGVLVQDPAEQKLLLVRSQQQLFGGLWNLPTVEGDSRREATELLRRLEIDAELGPRPSAEIEHVLSHRRLQIRLFRAELRGFAASEHLRLQEHARLSELGVSSLTRKALAALDPAQRALPLLDEPRVAPPERT
jgi:A/G-specific adenine glycosylase